MLKSLYYFSILAFVFIVACNSETTLKAKKLQISKNNLIDSRTAFNPMIAGFRRDSLNIKAVLKGNQINQIFVMLGSNCLDTIQLMQTKIPSGAEKDLIVSDYNFDGFCEFVIPDKKSAARGGMDYNYFLYDTLSRNFIEINTLPRFIGNFKLDVKNQRVKIYCPDEACFAYYKFENKVFNLVQGEYKANP